MLTSVSWLRFFRSKSASASVVHCARIIVTALNAVCATPTPTRPPPTATRNAFVFTAHGSALRELWSCLSTCCCCFSAFYFVCTMRAYGQSASSCCCWKSLKHLQLMPILLLPQRLVDWDRFTQAVTVVTAVAWLLCWLAVVGVQSFAAP